jgi:hypothetical protein
MPDVRECAARRERGGADAMTPRCGRVYCAAPVTTYESERYGRLLERARESFPGMAILAARDAWRDNADWLARWPDVCRTLDAMVCIPDASGWIGRGVDTEIRDADRMGIPIWWLADDGELISHRKVRLGPTNESNWRRYRQISIRSTQEKAQWTIGPINPETDQ